MTTPPRPKGFCGACANWTRTVIPFGWCKLSPGREWHFNEYCGAYLPKTEAKTKPDRDED